MPGAKPLPIFDFKHAFVKNMEIGHHSKPPDVTLYQPAFQWSSLDRKSADLFGLTTNPDRLEKLFPLEWRNRGHNIGTTGHLNPGAFRAGLYKCAKG